MNASLSAPPSPLPFIHAMEMDLFRVVAMMLQRMLATNSYSGFSINQSRDGHHRFFQLGGPLVKSISPLTITMDSSLKNFGRKCSNPRQVSN